MSGGVTITLTPAQEVLLGRAGAVRGLSLTDLLRDHLQALLVEQLDECAALEGFWHFGEKAFVDVAGTDLCHFFDPKTVAQFEQVDEDALIRACDLLDPERYEWPDGKPGAEDEDQVWMIRSTRKLAEWTLGLLRQGHEVWSDCRWRSRNDWLEYSDFLVEVRPGDEPEVLVHPDYGKLRSVA
jgi:hypothetical protein